MSQVVLSHPEVGALVGEGVTARVPQDVRPDAAELGTPRCATVVLTGIDQPLAIEGSCEKEAPALGKPTNAILLRIFQGVTLVSSLPPDPALQGSRISLEFMSFPIRKTFFNRAGGEY